MEELSLNCPLCCSDTFNSKEALIEHLSNITKDLFCPVCNVKVSSLEHLTEHLSIDCEPNMVQTLTFENSPNPENNEYQSDNSTPLSLSVDGGNLNTVITDHNFTQNLEMVDSDVNKMQLDLMKCLQNQDLRFLKEDGENRYIIVSGDSTSMHQEGLVTKQNKDGTISVTTLQDIKMESESIQEPAVEEQTVVQEYSCSTCKMSFTSVYDHINNYHTDQDVVVEGAIGEPESDAIIEFEPTQSEEVNDKQCSRRMITDTGDIVETPLVVKTSFGQVELVEQETTAIEKKAPIKTLKEQGTEKQGRKRYVQIDKLCDSVIRDLKPQEKNGPSHKVVVSPSILMPDGEDVKMYHCTSCDMFGNQLNDFKTQPCKPAKYACTHCTMVYDNSKSLCAHMKVHKDKTETASSVPEVFECEICSTVFLTNKSLKLHKRMHEPIKSRPIDPPRSSVNGTRYRCSTCDKMIPSEYRELHSSSHKYDNMLNCSICNKKFSSPDYLEMHMNVHNVEKVPQNKSSKSLPYSCLYCDRKFARPHEKVKHERIHTGEKPHSCEICGKSFRVSYCLTLHMRTHTGARPYACPHCDKRFKAHSVYNHHLLTHSEVRAYKCPLCPKAFKTSVQLAGHKNSHTKPFSCTHCNRPFASLYAVRIHTETHNRQNNLKFRCTLCGASYARAFALKDHIKQVHKDELEKEPLTGSEEWTVKGTEETEKDLSQITELAMTSEEFIVPN